jgi:riboflavin kinase / FMN adenylyltransferase
MVTADLLPAPAAAATRPRAAMRRCTQPVQLPSPAQVVAIGMFDGLHLGHRHVLQTLRALGDRHGLPTLVLTFDPHPRSVVGKQPPPRLLCTVDERLDLLAASGLVDTAVVLPFDAARSQEPVERFVADTLVGAIGMRALVVGANFACGHQRRGTVDRLHALGADRGFSVHTLALRPAQLPGDAPACSSTLIRRLIQAGDVAVAAALLGRAHALTAEVDTQRDTPIGAAGAARLPLAMCRPAAGRYRGAVARPGRWRDWQPAELEVTTDAGGEPSHVQWRCDSATPAGPVRLRFDDRLPA